MNLKSILRSLALAVAVLAVSALLGACNIHDHKRQNADGSLHHHSQ